MSRTGFTSTGDAEIPEKELTVAAYASPDVDDRPVTLSVPTTALALGLTAVFALLLYYFIGIDQGAVSVFGEDTHVHEFVHDARHFLGFPCH